jgi:hypothetical protein
MIYEMLLHFHPSLSHTYIQRKNLIYKTKRPATTAKKPVMPTPTWLAAPVNWAGGTYEEGLVGTPVPEGLTG